MKKKYKVLISVAIVLCVLATAISFSLRQEAQSQDDVPVIHPGRQTSARENGYDNAFGKSKHRKRKKGISATSYRGDFDVFPDAFVDSSEPQLTVTQRVGKWTCSADAVVVGVAGNKTTHLNREETFVYSEYNFKVQEVIKNNVFKPIEIDEVIQASRPGGSIRHGGRLIRFIYRAHTPLQFGGTYLLFLRYVPEANGYIALDSAQDYFLEGNNATPTILSKNKGDAVLPEPANVLLGIARSAAPYPSCGQN